MKEANYTILDKGFFRLLGTVCREFREQGIDYALVGGTGVQTRISEYLTHERKGRIDLVENLDMLLRKTDDLDFACRVEEGKIPFFFAMLREKNPPVEVEFTPRGYKVSQRERKGKTSVHVSCLTKPEEFKGLGDFYYNQIDNGSEIALAHGGDRVFVHVSPEYLLIASKLTRNSPKDAIDIHNLLRAMKKSGERFDPGRVYGVLNEADRGQFYPTLQEIVNEVEKE